MGQAVWEISFEPQDSGSSGLFHEEHGTEFFLKMELFKKFWDMWAADSQTGVLIQVSTVSKFPFSHTVISFALSGRELL